MIELHCDSAKSQMLLIKVIIDYFINKANQIDQLNGDWLTLLCRFYASKLLEGKSAKPFANLKVSRFWYEIE